MFLDNPLIALASFTSHESFLLNIIFLFIQVICFQKWWYSHILWSKSCIGLGCLSWSSLSFIGCFSCSGQKV